MTKQLFYFTAAILLAMPSQAQDKQRIYSLKEGEKLMVAESGLRASATPNSFMILVERENMNSPEGGTSYHIITDKEQYGPYGGLISDFFSGDMRRKATALPDINNDSEKGIDKHFVLFDDGKMMGPYNGFPAVSFNYDGSDWAIVCTKYNEEKNTSNTTIRFKSGAKDLAIDGAEYVEFAPKGNNSVRVSSTEMPDGSMRTGLTFNDGKKLGPWILNNYQFSPDGKSYITLREEKDGSRILSINETETPFENQENVSTVMTNDDASDWVAVGYQDDKAKLFFKNGTQTELFERVVESSILYDKVEKKWLYMTASKEKMSVELHLGDKVIHSFPFTEKDLQSSSDEPYFFAGGLITPSNDGKQMLIQYNINETLPKYALRKSGEAIKEIANTGVTFMGFDGKNRMYFVKEKPGKTEDDEYSYSLDGSNAPAKFKHYPDDLIFIENSDNWYATYWGDNGLQLSDGTFQENAFDVKYDKVAKKLTWLSLEGRDIYVNRKAF